MQEEIGLGGDDLVNLQTMYTVGAVVGQLPFAYLFTRVPISWLIPIMDIAWGIFTLLQYRATSYSEMMAYRFLVGWFEVSTPCTPISGDLHLTFIGNQAAFFPGMHYIFGAWYRGDEIARRGGCFYVGLTLGTLTASLIQAGASSRLDGVSGLAGWRWMFIICAIITIPIGILGFFVLPGTPDKPNRLILRQKDIQRGRERLERTGHRFTSSGFSTLQTCRSLLKSQKFYIFLVLDVLFWNAGLHASAGGYLLWLKSLQRFSTATLNNLSAIAPALGIFYTLFVCFLSDLWLGPAWAIVLAHTRNSLGLIILTIWEVPESAKWFAFSTIYACVAMSSVLYGWVNTELRYSPQERAVVLVVINAVSQSTTAWTPLLVFPTVEGPRFTKGYAFTLGSALALIVGTIGVWAVFRKKAMVSNGEEEEEIVVVQGKRDGKTEGTEQ
ncbi:MFS general substrate transporter [Aspergillus brunneoviolaceus CBS 621.78]|uniref:MFS general substrate transporter n=1 Tax=Aspergillus brunneoviolaceus CBS 621.78 TaxID=1450534 RepID=A0ACD1GHW2_9EURO|nr:MFS general substrate transporter [Aspergillus brunneoviolaceus CBS 621.78]RAH48738.1 MFS general substrate transporter [Aspergillus brunneoviolaceus CBS 621.78]